MQLSISITYNGSSYTLPLTVIRSKRYTYSITVREDCSIILRVPLQASKQQIEQIAEEKSHWIITHYLKAREERENSPHSDLPEAQRIALEKRYKEAARNYIPKRVAYYQPLTGGTYNRITIRSQRTRWGSCSGKGTLSFNWRLMLAPPAILDYVVVHELCHLTHMDHSPAFWEAVKSVYPNYKSARKWLKEHGNELIV
ncbi:MAG: M48 family metallopeptidase [Bacillus sp. (in: Bacteria)]|nr:M48 family metallopeptidase [Bacillus sp. (in: firmicutes)]MCM1426332.1 M48 family metallopeptidase [Eubacterium sp.]